LRISDDVSASFAAEAYILKAGHRGLFVSNCLTCSRRYDMLVSWMLCYFSRRRSWSGETRSGRRNSV